MTSCCKKKKKKKKKSADPVAKSGKVSNNTRPGGMFLRFKHSRNRLTCFAPWMGKLSDLLITLRRVQIGKGTCRVIKDNKTSQAAAEGTKPTNRPDKKYCTANLQNNNNNNSTVGGKKPKEHSKRSYQCRR